MSLKRILQLCCIPTSTELRHNIVSEGRYVSRSHKSLLYLTSNYRNWQSFKNNQQVLQDTCKAGLSVCDMSMAVGRLFPRLPFIAPSVAPAFCESDATPRPRTVCLLLWVLKFSLLLFLSCSFCLLSLPSTSTFATITMAKYQSAKLEEADTASSAVRVAPDLGTVISIALESIVSKASVTSPL